MQNSNVWSAAALLRADVRNRVGDKFGEVEDVIVDPDTGNIRYAIVSFRGAGLGDRLFAVPWRAFRIAPSRDYIVLDTDVDHLRQAPSFPRDAWPDVADPVWRRTIDDYYFRERYAGPVRPVYTEPPPVRRRSGISVLGGILLVCLLVALAWFTFFVATRGWDQARDELRNSFDRVVYAAKETSQDAALTAKVKTALSLSKRIPADEINVDSKGGVVTLRGEVPSNEVRQLAESVAGDVPGVETVANHLFVAGSQ